MAGRRIGRDAGGPRLVSAMTAAFAFGQLVGSLALREAASGRDAIVGPSFVAAALLVLSAIALRSCGAVRNAVLNDERITR